MAEPRNLANALIILGSLYVLIFGGLGTWGKIGVFFILFFGLSTWGHWYMDEKSKEAKQAIIDESIARKVNLNAHSQLMLVQTKLVAGGIRH